MKAIVYILSLVLMVSIASAVSIDIVNKNGYMYGTSGTVYTAYLKQASNAGDGIKYCQVTIDGTKCLTYQPQDMSYRDVYNSQDYIGSIAYSIASVNDDTLTYNNIYPDVSLRYTIKETTFKEDYIIGNELRLPAIYLTAPITLDFGGYIKYDTGMSIIVDGINKTGQDFETNQEITFQYKDTKIFRLPKPHVLQSGDSEHYYNAKYKVKNQGGQIYFYVSVPYEWLDTATYPVQIDPSVAPGTYYQNTTLLTSGFETSIDNNFTNAGTWTRDTAVKRTGTASAKLPSSAVANRWLNSVSVNTTNCSTVYVTIYSQDDDMDDADEVWLRVKNSSGSWVNSGTELGLLTEDNFVANSLTLTEAQWKYSTFQISINNGGALDTKENLWIDDVEIICSTPYTVPNMTIVLNNPSNATTISDSTPEFNFTGTDPGAYPLEYQIQIATGTDFSTILYMNMDSFFDPTMNFYSLNNNSEIAQAFTANGEIITNMSFKLVKKGSPSGIVRAYIYNIDNPLNYGSTSEPTGSPLATSNDINVNLISTTPSWITFDLNNSEKYSTIDGSYYFVSIHFIGIKDTSNYINTTGTTTSGHSGNAATKPSSSWYSYAYDRNFEIKYYTEPELIINSFSENETGFTDVTDGTDTHPFDSGDKINYTVQAGDALADGTYYWRVRVNDPTGSDTWSPWSSIYQFIVSTSVAETECNYTGSGNWLVNCATNCVINVSANIGTNDFITYGTGSVNLRTSVTARDFYLSKTTCPIYVKKSVGALYVKK